MGEPTVAGPGFASDAGWSVTDLVAHVGTWLAEAGMQLERIAAGSCQAREIDIDALSDIVRHAMAGQLWKIVLTQAEASRYRMPKAWRSLPERNDAAWWVAKAGADHDREHLEDLRERVAALRGRA